MGYIMKEKRIYLTVSQDRYNLLTNLRNRLGIMAPPADYQSTMSISNNVKESEDEEMDLELSMTIKVSQLSNLIFHMMCIKI